jgi:hypothetical protein
MRDSEHDQTYSSMLENKSIVYEYFRLIKQRDINGLLSLFADDAVLCEPFSNISAGLQGKSAIKPFLEIAMMANSGLTHSIAIEKPSTNNNNNNDKANKEGHYNDDDNTTNKITALVTFQRGDSIRARFTFELAPILMEYSVDIHSSRKKIQRLNIQFINR